MRYLLVLSLCAFSAQATTNYQAECITKARSFIGKIVTKNQLNLAATWAANYVANGGSISDVSSMQSEIMGEIMNNTTPEQIDLAMTMYNKANSVFGNMSNMEQVAMSCAINCFSLVYPLYTELSSKLADAENSNASASAKKTIIFKYVHSKLKTNLPKQVAKQCKAGVGSANWKKFKKVVGNNVINFSALGVN